MSVNIIVANHNTLATSNYILLALLSLLSEKKPDDYENNASMMDSDGDGGLVIKN